MYCKEEIEKSRARMNRALACPVTIFFVDVQEMLYKAWIAFQYGEYSRMNAILDGLLNRYGYEELK